MCIKCAKRLNMIKLKKEHIYNVLQMFFYGCVLLSMAVTTFFIVTALRYDSVRRLIADVHYIIFKCNL